MNDELPATDVARHEFLTARQLAVILQVSESTVRRLAQQGRIPSIRITSRILRFHLQSVRDALDGTSTRSRSRRHPANQSSDDDPQLSFVDFS